MRTTRALSPVFVLELVREARDIRRPAWLLKQLAKPGVALLFLKHIRNDRRLLARIARDSYRHENGFDKIVLSPRRSARRLRLHVWHPGEGESDFHNHRWDFDSLVLHGEFVHVFYRPAPKGKLFHHYRYHPRRGRDQFTLSFQGMQQLAVARTRTLQAPFFYHQKSTYIHEFRLLSQDIGLTMVIQGPTHRRVTDVYMLEQSPKPSHKIIRSRAMTLQELCAHLDRSIQLLESRRA